MKKISWLMVANSSLARLFTMEARHHLNEFKVFEHPESRLHNLDLVSDKPGRDFESMGTRAHAYQAKTLPKQHECVLFAKQLADYLEEAYNQEKFQVLYLAASPSLLGLLRQSFHPNIVKSIKEEIDQDITHIKPTEISSHFHSIF